MLLWWTDEDYKRVKKWIKVVYILLTIRATSCMILSLWYLAMHSENKPIAIILQDVAICLAGLVASFGAIIFPLYRNRTSTLLRTINEINLDILPRTQENRNNSNRLFLGLFILCGVGLVSGSMSFLIFGWQFAKSGLPNFNSFLYQPTPYSVMAFVDEILFLVIAIWISSLCTFYYTMYIEFILRISFYFRVTAGEMRQLRRGENFEEDKEMEKLKFLIKDLNLVYW